jgi:hypothetical protein
MDMTATARSAATLVVLGLIFVGGLTWAWSQVTEPFPEAAETPDCTDTMLSPGDEVVPSDVLVSVLNASDRDGLASETMGRLKKFGFGVGDLGNASAIKDGAQIWTSDPDSPVTKMLRSYLGKDVKVVDQASTAPGVTVVVGDKFPGVSKGIRRQTVSTEVTVCSPPPPSDASVG